eukprot:763532-Hanusia_phi.AAC.1
MFVQFGWFLNSIQSPPFRFLHPPFMFLFRSSPSIFIPHFHPREELVLLSSSPHLSPFYLPPPLLLSVLSPSSSPPLLLSSSPFYLAPLLLPSPSNVESTPAGLTADSASGYIALFSAAFSIAPLLSWMNNLIEVRLDARKLTSYSRRPLVKHAKELEFWIEVLELLAYLGLICNVVLLGLGSFSLRDLLGLSQDLPSTSLPPAVQYKTAGELSSSGKDFRGRVTMLWFMLGMEHAIFFIKIGFAFFLEDAPGWVKEAEKGIRKYRNRKYLESAFQHDDEGSGGQEFGRFAGELKGELMSAMHEKNVSDVLDEMVNAPSERARKQERIMSLLSVVQRQGLVDDKGLPLGLDQAIMREEQLPNGGKLGTGRNFTASSELGFATISQEPIANLVVKIVEAIRPHVFMNSDKNVELREADFLFFSLRASGPGFQHKTNTRIVETSPTLSWKEPILLPVQSFPVFLEVMGQGEEEEVSRSEEE